MNHKIIVVAFNGFNSYGMVRSLGEGGIKPYLILPKNDINFVSKSKWAGPVIYYSEKEEIPELLMSNFGKEEFSPIVICCEDQLQSLVDLNYDFLSSYFILSNCRGLQGEITRLMDKDLQINIARECGVTVPKTWKINKGSTIPSDMVYPCIAKPELSIRGSKMQITVCRSREELAVAISNRDYLVQEFIEKDYESIIWGTSLGDGQYYMPVVCKKIRQYPDANSLSSFGVLESFEEHPGLKKDCLSRFLKTLGYRGMFSIEMAVKDEKYYLLEINLRNDGKQYFSTAAGANLPLLYINSLIGNPFVEPKVKTPIYFMGETTDVKQIFNKKVSAFKWLRDLFRTKSFFVLNWKDPKPFIYQSWGKLIKHFH